MIRIRPTARIGILPRSHRPDRRRMPARRVAPPRSTREPPSASSSPRCKPALDYPSPRWLTPRMSAVRPWSAACSGSRQPGRSKKIAPADGGRARRSLWRRRCARRGWSRALRRRRCEGGGRTPNPSSPDRLRDGSSRSRPITGVRVPRCTEDATGEPRRGDTTRRAGLARG